MLFDNHVTISGNVTRAPELRFTASEMPVCTFSVAQNEKSKTGDRDDRSHFFDVVCFNQCAKNVAASVDKGHRVTVDGALHFRQWEDKETGDPRRKHEIVANDVAVSLKWVSVTVGARLERSEDPPRVEADLRPASTSATGSTRYVVDEEPF